VGGTCFSKKRSLEKFPGSKGGGGGIHERGRFSTTLGTRKRKGRILKRILPEKKRGRRVRRGAEPYRPARVVGRSRKMKKGAKACTFGRVKDNRSDRDPEKKKRGKRFLSDDRVPQQNKGKEIREWKGKRGRMRGDTYVSKKGKGKLPVFGKGDSLTEAEI